MNKLREQSDYVVGEIRRRCKYVLVDEYQDTDGRQENRLRQILGDKPNVTVVGDEDQLVYTWRHAKIENILEFQQRWDAHSVRLEQNFRTTQNVLDCANLLIRNNKNRLETDNYTYEDEGADVNNHAFKTASDEAIRVVNQIAQANPARG